MFNCKDDQESLTEPAQKATANQTISLPSGKTTSALKNKSIKQTF